MRHTAGFEWAFAHRTINEVVSVIVPANTASVRAAERLGMTSAWTEYLLGADHTVFVVTRSDGEKRAVVLGC
jgi:RimJ/RimL family protein N-acetyltransferase